MKNVLASMVICFAIVYLWMALEIVYYGEIRPSEVDTIVGFVLWLSLTFNFVQWNKPVKKSPKIIIKIENAEVQNDRD